MVTHHEQKPLALSIHRPGCVLLVVLLLLAVCIVAGTPVLRRVVRAIGYQGSSSVQFVSADWKRTALVYNPPFIRSQMIGDLMRRYRLVGLAKRDIHRILGKPDYVLPSSYHYFLRPDGWGDAVVLELRFDGQGRVISAQVCSN